MAIFEPLPQVSLTISQGSIIFFLLEEQLRQNEKGWDGRDRDKLGTSQKIVKSGGVVSGPYVPQGTKRIGEVGEFKWEGE